MLIVFLINENMYLTFDNKSLEILTISAFQ